MPIEKLLGVWDKIEMVFGGRAQPVLEKMHLEMRVELRRQRRSKPGGRAMSIRRKHYNMTAMFEDGTRTSASRKAGAAICRGAEERGHVAVAIERPRAPGR
jgi:hypothetical protein